MDKSGVDFRVRTATVIFDYRECDFRAEFVFLSSGVCYLYLVKNSMILDAIEVGYKEAAFDTMLHYADLTF